MGDFVVFVVVFGLGGVVLLALLSQKGGPPGMENGALAEPGSAPNAVCSEPQTQPERKVAPLKATLAEARQAVMDTGGTIRTETDTYIAATYMTKLMKFVDDVELRDTGEGTVHIRSASRIGYSDGGLNRRRVAQIRSKLPH